MKSAWGNATVTLVLSLTLGGATGCDGLGLRRDDPSSLVDAAAGDGGVDPRNPDARSAPTPDASPDAPPALMCKDPVSNVSSGVHNAGRACMSCHTGSGEAPRFTVAGTLYNSNGAAIGGATISVVDASNRKFDIVTKRNGNFYTGTSMTFPIHVVASKCPSAEKMNAAITNGNCNSSGCHAATGGAGRIELP